MSIVAMFPGSYSIEVSKRGSPKGTRVRRDTTLREITGSDFATSAAQSVATRESVQ